jgi:hypothetical protein
MAKWYALVGHEVVGPFETSDMWYHEHGGPDWRGRVIDRGHPDPWLVGYDVLPGDKAAVSTVFLGLDHTMWVHEEDAPPVVFETMIFPESEVFARYSSWQAAEVGHAEAVASVAARR